MLVCRSCKDQLGPQQDRNGRSFPAYTAAATLVGTIVGTMTGTLLAIPFAFFAGLGADALSRRCELCDAEIDKDDEGYFLMEELGDEIGGKTYRPVSMANTTQKDIPHHSQARPDQTNPRPPQNTNPTRQSDLPNQMDRSVDDGGPSEFIFDETQGKFVQQQSEPPSFNNHGGDLDLPDSPIDGLSIQGDMPHGFDLDDEIGIELFGSLWDLCEDGLSDVGLPGLDDQPSGGDILP